MHPVKERILRYEAKYGFNLEARRAFNQAIRGGGKNPWKWFMGLFKSKSKTKNQQRHHVSNNKQPTKVTFSTIQPRYTLPYKVASSPTIQPHSTLPHNGTLPRTVRPHSTPRHTQPRMLNIPHVSTTTRKRKHNEPLLPKQKYGLKYVLSQTKKHPPRYGLKHVMSQMKKHPPRSGLKYVLSQQRKQFSKPKEQLPIYVPSPPKKQPKKTPTRIASSLSTTKTHQARPLSFPTPHTTTPKATHQARPLPFSTPRTPRSTTNPGTASSSKPKPNKSSRGILEGVNSSLKSHKTRRVTRTPGGAPKTSVKSVWYEGRSGYDRGTTNTRRINNGDVTITLPHNRIINTTLDKVTFKDPKRFQEAYCHLYNSIRHPSSQDKENLSNLNYYFKEHEHGGGGDCFLYAWLGSSLEQNNGKGYDERVKDLLQTCPQWNTIQRYKQEVAKGIFHKNKHILQKRIKEKEMLCLREVVGNFMRVELERRSNRLQTRDKEYMKDVIRRISTKGTWLQDADIIKIADYMNMRFFVFVEAYNTWQIYEPPSNPENIDIPTYYMINKGGSNSGWAGYHYKSLTKLYKGNFDCH